MNSVTPPPLSAPRTPDLEHLRVLAILHFVGAGLAVAGLLFLVGHYAFVHAFVGNPALWKDAKGGPPPSEFFAMFRWFYLAAAVWFVASLVLNLLSGVFLRARRHRTFSLVVSGMNCVHVPLGAALGIFTIIVLTRDSVRALYAEHSSSP